MTFFVFTTIIKIKSKGDDILAKKPKLKWQAEAKAELETRGMTYTELGEAIGVSYFMVNQAMCKDCLPGTKKKICEYLGIAED